MSPLEASRRLNEIGQSLHKLESNPTTEIFFIEKRESGFGNSWYRVNTRYDEASALKVAKRYRGDVRVTRVKKSAYIRDLEREEKKLQDSMHWAPFIDE